MLFIFFLSFLFPQSAFAVGEFVTTWKTDNSGVSTASQITIPTHPDETYNYTVDWGDASSNVGVTGSMTHTYASPGTYTVTISGTFPRIYFNNGGDKDKILSVEAWGTIVWTSMANAFYGASNLVVNAIDAPDLTSVTNLSGMFRDATSVDVDITTWDLSTVTTVSSMFEGATAFNNQNVGFWFFPPSVTDMSNMFKGATAFDGSNPFLWEVSNVTNMSGMFEGATALNMTFSQWNTSSVTDMSNMFKNATSFNNGNENLTFDIQSVTNMSGMFEGATSFDMTFQQWNTSSVTDMSNMFKNATTFNQDISGFDVSNVTNMSDMFDGVTLSTVNYDALLADWSALTLESGVTFDGGNSAYCASIAERASIISTYGWTITDGGTTCGIATTTSTTSSGSSAQSRVQNLLAMGNIQAADMIMKEFPNQFDTPKVTQLCATDQFITQKLKSGSVDGKYNYYTKGIVKEAKILQAHLNRLGFNAGKEDGNLGPISDKAIKRMQTYFNIKPDGYVGQITMGFINNSCK